MNKLKKIYTNNYLLFVVLSTLLTLVYLPALGSEPFGDDMVEIFDSWLVNTSSHPFTFWNPFSIYFKSWPATYSTFWVLIKLFGKKYYLYRIINILAHCFCAILLKKLLQRFKLTDSLIAILLVIFTFHPLAVETILWIIQLKTLFSTLFCLLAIKYYLNARIDLKDQDYYKALACFTASLLFKATYLLLPLALLYKFKPNKIFIKRNISFFLISLFLGTITTKGIVAREKESDEMLRYDSKIIFKPVKSIDIKKHYNFDESSKNENLMTYLKSNFSYIGTLAGALNSKLAITSYNLVFYLKSYLGINQYMPVYPKPKAGSFELIFSIFLSGILFYLFLFEQNNTFKFCSILLILSFIPISGLFYIPYFKFSSVADHYIYPSLAFISFLFIYKVKDKKYVKVVSSLLALVLVAQTTIYTQRYKSTDEMFKFNLKKYDSTILHEYLTEHYKNAKNFEKALDHVLRADTILPNRMVIIMNIAYISNQVRANNLTYEAIIKVASIYHAHGKYQLAMNELSRFAEDVPKHYRASLILATSIVASKSSYKLLEVIFNKMKVNLK